MRSSVQPPAAAAFACDCADTPATAANATPATTSMQANRYRRAISRPFSGSTTSVLLCSRPGTVVDEKPGNGLVLRRFRGIQRGPAVEVRGIDVDAELGREPDRFESQRFPLGAF